MSDTLASTLNSGGLAVITAGLAALLFLILVRYFWDRYDLRFEGDSLIDGYEQLPGVFLPIAFVLLNTLLLGGISFTLLFVIAFLGQLAILLYETFPTLLSQPWAIVVSIGTGLLFYWLRSRAPFTYGLSEIVVAAVTMWIALAAKGDAGTKSLALLGAIYVMVRGLDNVDKGLPLRFRRAWDRAFPKAAKTEAPAAS